MFHFPSHITLFLKRVWVDDAEDLRIWVETIFSTNRKTRREDHNTLLTSSSLMFMRANCLLFLVSIFLLVI